MSLSFLELRPRTVGAKKLNKHVYINHVTLRYTKDTDVRCEILNELCNKFFSSDRSALELSLFISLALFDSLKLTRAY